MRYIFLLLILSPLFSFGQAKKDSKIVVTVLDTANLFNRTVLYLYEQGYALEAKDEALKYISTKDKPLGKQSASIKVNVLVKDSILTISGAIADDVQLTIGGITTTRTFMPIEYRGLKRSAMMLAWEELEKIAKSFGTLLTYSK